MPRSGGAYGRHCTGSAGVPCHDPCHDQRATISSCRTRCVTAARPGPLHVDHTCGPGAVTRQLPRSRCSPRAAYAGGQRDAAGTPSAPPANGSGRATRSVRTASPCTTSNPPRNPPDLFKRLRSSRAGGVFNVRSTHAGPGVKTAFRLSSPDEPQSLVNVAGRRGGTEAAH